MRYVLCASLWQAVGLHLWRGPGADHSPGDVGKLWWQLPLVPVLSMDPLDTFSRCVQGGLAWGKSCSALPSVPGLLAYCSWF